MILIISSPVLLCGLTASLLSLEQENGRIFSGDLINQKESSKGMDITDSPMNSFSLLTPQ